MNIRNIFFSVLCISSLSTPLFSKNFDLVINSTDIQYIKKAKDYKKIISRVKNYRLFFDKTKELSDIKKVTRVNNFFNKYKYINDDKNYSKNDYWASRKEFILKGGGDCEDYAIAKYYTLLELGIDEGNISLSSALYKNKGHMVVLYKRNNTNYVLDNNNLLLLPIYKRTKIKLLRKIKVIKKNKRIYRVDNIYNKVKYNKI
jgi:predicted transglutaminase-like cysteine proteinase